MTTIMELMKFFIRGTMAKACNWSRKRMEVKLEADNDLFS
jgi:hypothetical protein